MMIFGLSVIDDTLKYRRTHTLVYEYCFTIFGSTLYIANLKIQTL